MLGFDDAADAAQRAHAHTPAKLKLAAKRSLVLLLTVAMTFGSTPAELWAEGAQAFGKQAEALVEGQGEGGAAAAAAAPQTADEAELESLGEAAGGQAVSDEAAEDDASDKSPSSGSDAQQPAESGEAVKTDDEQNTEPAVDADAEEDDLLASSTDASVLEDEGKESAASNDGANDEAAQAAETSSAGAVSANQADTKVRATCSVIGVDESGNAQTWAASQNFTLENGATAAELSEAAFKQAGLTASYTSDTAYGWYLSTITSPYDAGQVLGWDEATGKYWQIFVNGEALQVGAGSYTLNEGDQVVWAYSAYGDAAPTDQLAVQCEVLGQDAAGAQQTWAALATLTMPQGSTAADLSEALFKQAGISASYTANTAYGWYLSSITSPFDSSVTLAWDSATGKYWQLLVNGEMASVGAGSVKLKAGDRVSWVYGSDGVLPDQLKASVQLIGQDEAGNTQIWADTASYAMLKGATAADLTMAMFQQTGITADYDPNTAYGFYLKTITSPFDSDLTLGWDEATGKYWQLFVNGEASQLGASGVVLQAGDQVVWCYSAYGSGLPKTDDGSSEVVTHPEAYDTRPKSYTSAWPSYGSGQSTGAVVETATPTASTTQEWAVDVKGKAIGVSDPIIVNGNVYMVKGSRLVMLSGSTGKELKSANIGSAIKYFSRPAYADGLIVVPTAEGSLLAFTADTLTCVWKSEAVGVKDAKGNTLSQALTSVTISNGQVYAGFTVPNGSSTATEGILACVDLATGKLLWKTDKKTSETGSAEGYYWANAVASGSDIIIGNDAGKVALVSGENGSELSSVNVGSPVRAGVVAVDADAQGNGCYLAVSRSDGTLYKIRRTGNKLALVGKVAFAKTSTSTPAVCDGKAYVCGMDAEGYGTLNVIDLASMKVLYSVRGGKGAAQSSPLVSKQGGNVYAYFTVNEQTGGVYAYKLGDASASLVFAPESGKQNYCTASVVSDAEGNLYYTNDSGYLFKLKGADAWTVTFNSNGGTSIAKRYVAKHKPVSRPADPTRAGYTFKGWFFDAALTQAWNFDNLVTEDMTLYAKWEKKAAASNGGGDNNDGGDEENGGDEQSTVVRYYTRYVNGGGNSLFNSLLLGTGAGLRKGPSGSSASHKASGSLSSSLRRTGSAATGTAANGGENEGAASESSSGEDAAVAEAATLATKKTVKTVSDDLALNPWAVAGAVAGLAGLGALAWFFLLGKRRKDDEDEEQA